MNKKSICESCANNNANRADDIFKRLEKGGIYIQCVGNVNACVFSGERNMTCDDEGIVSCSAYVRREDKNHDND